MQKEGKKVWNRRNRQYKKLCDKVVELQQQIDRMNLDFKREIEEISDKNEQILKELIDVQELLRILLANELLKDVDILVQE